MDLLALIRDLGAPVAMAAIGVWALVTGRVIARPSHDVIVANCGRELANLKEAHIRELAGKDEVIADLHRRVEAGDITSARVMEMAFRSVLAGEKAADTAVTALRGKS